jgi:hypothetical protein
VLQAIILSSPRVRESAKKFGSVSICKQFKTNVYGGCSVMLETKDNMREDKNMFVSKDNKYLT